MVQKYLEELTKIVNSTVSEDFSQENLRYNHFFNGAAAYVNDKIFCTYTPAGIAVKLPIAKRDNLIALNKGSELRYFEKSPVKKDYVVLNEENNEELKLWILIALDYTLNGKIE